MKKKIVLGLMLTTICAAAIVGCGASNSNNTSKAASKESETEEKNAGVSNPWVDTDKDGLAEATGIELSAPDGATNVLYSYMKEDNLAQVSYELDSAKWVYRAQSADELTDISGLNYKGMTEEKGTVSNRDAIYYSHAAEDDEDSVQMVNWYDVVTGITYSLSATGKDLDGMDIQAYAEAVYVSLQDDATDDADADSSSELNDYFIGEHTKSDDGSTLAIAQNSDGTYSVDINITRLCSLENGIGTFADHKMTFTVQDPSENELQGIIYRDSDGTLTVKITDSTWEYLPDDEVISGFED